MKISRKEFVVYYPPEYNKKTGKPLKRKIYKIITVDIHTDIYGNDWLTEDSRHEIDVNTCKAWLEKNIDNYTEWMYLPNNEFGGKRPVDLLKNIKTIKKIHAFIDNIKKNK
jgi:hypothetical protein